jgi:hypothetical protein
LGRFARNKRTGCAAVDDEMQRLAVDDDGHDDLVVVVAEPN